MSASTTGKGTRTAALALALVVAVLAAAIGFSGDRTPPADEGTCLPTSSGSPRAVSGSVVMPLAEGTYEMTSPFGPRTNPVTGAQEGHQGQDYSAPLGTAIHAATDGTVAQAGKASGFGNWIIVDTTVGGQQLSTVYGHMLDSGVLVHTGDTVTAGQHIADVGNAGESTGPHLHFEVWPGTRLGGGSPVDPVTWLADAGAGPPPTDAPETVSPAPAGSADLAAARTSTASSTAPAASASTATAHRSSRDVRLAAAVKPGCGRPAGTTGLRPGSVPPEFEPWIVKAGTVCPEVTAPIVAAQLQQESGFRVDAHNAGSGADGPAQFIPRTWAAKGVDGDGDGRTDTRSVADAVMSQAAYDCELAGIAKGALAQGKLSGDLTQLYLSMYNCGDGNTLGQGRVCQNAETLDYVERIPRTAAEKFAVAIPGAGGGIVPGGPFGTTVVAAAMRWLGTPYAWGGGDQNGPTTGIHDGGVADSYGDFAKVGFDCSGLVQYAVAQASGGAIVLDPPDSAQVADPRGTHITDPAGLQPGDIVQPNPGHIFIWVGPHQIVEAPQSGGVVQVRDWTPPATGLVARRFG